MQKKGKLNRDIDSLNQNILHIDLGDLEVEPMEQRIEMTLATLFGGDLFQEPGEPSNPCGQYVCSQYS